MFHLKGHKEQPSVSNQGAARGFVDVESAAKVEKRARELGVVNEILSKAGTTGDIEELLESTLDSLLKVPGYRCGAAYLMEGAGLNGRRTAYRGFKNEPPLVFDDSGGLFPATAMYNRLIEISDIAGPMHPAVREALEGEGLKGSVALPVLPVGNPIGLILLGCDADPLKAEEDRGLFEAVKEALELGAQNALLRARVAERARETTALLRLSRSLTGALDLDATLDSVVREAAELLHVDRSGLFLFDRETGVLTRMAWYGIGAEETRGLTLELSDVWTATEAARTLKPVAVFDASEDPRTYKPLVEKFGLKGMLVAPLVRDGEFMGVLNMVVQAPRAFNEREIELAESFARQAAVAIHNASLVRSLAESEVRYRSVVEAVQDIIFTLDSEGNLTYANQGIYSVLGYRPEEVVGRGAAGLVPREYHDQLRGWDGTLRSGGSVVVGDIRVPARDGSEKVLNLAVNPVVVDGNLVGFTGIGRDVTDRTRADEALRESEARYRALVESSQDSILIVSPHGRVLFANAASQRVARMPLADIIGKNIYSIVHPDDRQSVVSRVYGEWKKGKCVTRYPIRVVAGGEERHFEATSAILGEPGPEANTMLIVSDVTERKRAARQLEESEERYRTILEATQDAIVVVNRAGEMLYGNPAFGTVFGIPPEEAMGRNLFRYVHPDDRERAAAHLLNSFKLGNTTRNFPVKGQREDGSRIHLLVTTGLVGWPGDEALAISVVRDVTESHHQQAERELQLKFEEARAAITSRFVDPVNLYSAIKDTLEGVGELLDLSRGYFYEVAGDGESALEPLEWVARDSGLELDVPPEFSVSDFTWWLEAFRERKETAFSDIEEMPGEVERDIQRRRGVLAAALEPVFIGDRLAGALGFADAKSHRRWSVQELRFFRGIADTISRALERKEWIENLARSERFRTLITESVGEGLFVVKNRVITWANRQTGDIYGYKPEEMVGLSTESLFPDRESFDQRGDLVYSSLKKTGRYAAETRLRRKDGTVFDAAVSARSLEAEWEEGGQVVVAVRDITEAKRMHEEVAAAAEAYSTLFSSAGDGLIVHTVEGEIHDANERACAYTGHSREELLGLNIKDLIPEDSLSMYEVVIKEIERKGSIVFEAELARKGGGLIPVEVTARRTNIWGETVILSAQRDITERKKDEEQKKRRTRQIAALNQIVKAATSSLDPNVIVEAILGVGLEVVGGDCGVVILEAPPGKGIFRVMADRGYSESLAGKMCEEGVNNVLVDLVSEAEGSLVVSTGDMESVPGLRELAGGLDGDGLKTSVYIPLKSGDTLMGILGLSSGATDAFDTGDLDFLNAAGAEIGVSVENALIYRQLAEEHERLSLLYRSAQSISGDVELDSLLATTAEQAARAVGAESALLALVDPAYGEFVWKASYNLDLGRLKDVSLPLGEGAGGRMFKGKRAVVFPSKEFGEEKMNDDPVLSTFGIRSGVVVPLISGDKVVGGMGVHKPGGSGKVSDEDVLLLEAFGRQAGVAIENVALYEETKRHLVALERAHEELMVLDQMKSDFVSTVSHELRSPLAVIEGFASTLVENFDRIEPEIQKESIEIIQKKSVALEGLIENILDMSRIEGGRLEIDFEPVDIVKICEALCADQERVVETHEFTLESAEREVKVLADPEKAEVALVNLVRNAVKFAPDGGTVSIVVRESGDMAEVSVIDRGVGIPTEELERIFDRFYQVDSSETRSFAGTGLGLYITRELMHAMGGTVSVESEPGLGSTFTLAFPLARSQGRSAERS